MIKMIVSDYDGTLTSLTSKKENGVSVRNIEAIQRFQNNGGKFVIATGRHPSYMEKVLRDALRIDAIVGYSGGLLWVEHEVFMEEFSKKEISALLHFTMSHKDLTSIFLCNAYNDFYYTDHESYAYRRRLKKLNSSQIQDIRSIKECTVSDYLSCKEEDKICRVCLSFEEVDRMDEVYSLFMGCFKNEYQLIQTGPRQFEILKQGINKSSQIKALIKRFNMLEDEVAVVGDSYNDLPMFQDFYYSFCMADTTFNVRHAARFTVQDVAEVVEFTERKG